MNIGREYRKGTLFFRLLLSHMGLMMLCMFGVCVSMALRKPDHVILGFAFGMLLFVVLSSIFCALLTQNPLREYCPLIERWLKFGLGTVDEFPLYPTDRKKTRRNAERELNIALDIAFSRAEKRDELVALFENHKKRHASFYELPKDRKERADLEDEVIGWSKQADDAFKRFRALWDFFKDMKMLPMKPPQNPNGKPRPWKDATASLKAMKKERAEKKLAANLPLARPDVAPL